MRSRESKYRRIPLRVYGTSGWDRDAFLLPGVNLDFDRIEYRNFPLVVLNLRAPSVLLGFQVGGIVGHKFLERLPRVDGHGEQRAEAREVLTLRFAIAIGDRADRSPITWSHVTDRESQLASWHHGFSQQFVMER